MEGYNANQKENTSSMATKLEHQVNPALHSSAPVWETRQKYCEPGFRGLFSSSYVVLCAAFATLF